MHSTMQTDDREEEGISAVMFAFLAIFSINSASESTMILVTIYSTLELSNRVMVLDQTPQNLRDNPGGTAK